MKKIIALTISIVLLCGLTACSSKEKAVEKQEITTQKAEAVQETYNGVPLVRVCADRMIYDNFKELEEAADLVVIGEFAEEAQQTLEYQYMGQFGKEVITGAVSSNVIKVNEVLKGEQPEGDIKISQRYGYDKDNNNQLVTFSDLTPMEKGDKWVFFLFWSEEDETYWTTGDYTGRYPLPTAEIKQLCKSTGDTQRVKENIDWGNYDNYADVEIYNDIIEAYGL